MNQLATTSTLLATLPATFSYTDARRSGLSERRLRALRASGELQELSRGLYLRSDAPLIDTDLLQIAARSPEATLCLRSALARHELIDDIPSRIDIALPRGRRAPSINAPARWHHFDPRTFNLGRDTLALAPGLTIGVFNAQRTLIDAFRLRHLEGPELAIDALKAWLRRGDSKPAALLKLAASFPHAEPALRCALDILL